MAHASLHRMLEGDLSDRITFEQRPERRSGKESCGHLAGFSKCSRHKGPGAVVMLAK